ncbi:MAG: prepilin-type N-terminal cleavage/methylation domain-containing protein [bacterium]|nr:prepilin-type N-terminal cleavage/methylation domain-containing protein [bacterium]
MSSARTVRSAAGFSMLELLVAMSIFSVLGAMTIFLMNRGLEIFQKGTQEGAKLDKQGTILPLIEEDLKAVMVVQDADAPPPPPEDDDLNHDAREALPPAPVLIRVRAGTLGLTGEPDGPLKGYPMYWFSVVLDISGGIDPMIANLPTGNDEAAKSITPTSVENRTADTIYKPTGGMLEVLYIAAPTDPTKPAMLTLFRSFRSPIGHPENSLLDPTNFDTLAEIRKVCRPMAEGVLHFGATWRRVFATSWDLETSPVGRAGGATRYVGPQWDSTRGAEKTFALFAGKQSLVDPSDDVFPAFVRLDITLAGAGSLGYGQGELSLREAVDGNTGLLSIDDPDILLRPGLGRDRWLKVEGEWMSYTTSGVDYVKKKVRVQRGKRGTKKQSHPSGAWVHVGESSQREIRMPVYFDRFTLPKEGTR